MKNSHNSYWIKGNPLLVSIATGCDIIEADIIDKHLNLSHSWRPFKCMYYGNLINRYLHNFPKSKYLYIEFKTGDIRAADALFYALSEYNIPKIVLGTTPHLFINRMKVKEYFIDTYSECIDIIDISTLYVKNIDLYEKKWYMF